MAVDRLINIEQLQTNRLGEISKREKVRPYFHYDKDLDELIILAVPPEVETVVHYIDGEEHVAILYQADNFEIVGLQIEDFESGFIPKYASVEKAWKLSDCANIDNLWDMTVKVERMKPIVAHEIAKASSSLLGEKGKRLEKVFA